MLKVELALRDRFGGNHMTADMLLNCFGGSKFEIVGVELAKVISVVVGCHVVRERCSPARYGCGPPFCRSQFTQYLIRIGRKQARLTVIRRPDE